MKLTTSMFPEKIYLELDPNLFEGVSKVKEVQEAVDEARFLTNLKDVQSSIAHVVVYERKTIAAIVNRAPKLVPISTVNM